MKIWVDSGLTILEKKEKIHNLWILIPWASRKGKKDNRKTLCEYCMHNMHNIAIEHILKRHNIKFQHVLVGKKIFMHSKGTKLRI